MATSTRSEALTTTEALEGQADRMFEALRRQRLREPLAAALLRIRVLPLGRQGTVALARIPRRAFERDKALWLPHPRLRGAAIPLPNEFSPLGEEAIQALCRAMTDARWFRGKMWEMGFIAPTNWNWMRFARLVEAVAYRYGDQMLQQVYNFRIPVCWPEEQQPASVVAPSGSETQGQKRRPRRRYLAISKLCRALKREIGKSNYEGGEDRFVALPAPTGLSPEETAAYRIVLYIWSRRPHETNWPESLLRYAYAAFRLLEAGRARKSVPESKVNRRAANLIREAVTQLKLPSPRLPPWTRRSPKLSVVKLPKPRDLEELIVGTKCPVDDLRRATAAVLLHIDLFSGRRSSDWALVTLGEFSGLLAIDDLTIPETKTKSMRDIRLPLNRLLPTDTLDFVRRWHAEAMSRYPKETTVFELVTGKRRLGTARNHNVRNDLVAEIVRLTGFPSPRLHQLRKAFATWAMIAAFLARHGGLEAMPVVVDLVRGSTFFSSEQLANWSAMTRALDDPVNVICHCLGHRSPDQLVRRYSVAWPILVQMRAELARACDQG